MNNFGIDNSTASLAPFSQTWNSIEVGIDHNGAPIYSAFKEINMQFEGGSITFAKEWIDVADGAPHTIDCLNEMQLGYKTLSSVYIRVDQYPTINAGIAGPFSLTILRAT